GLAVQRGRARCECGPVLAHAVRGVRRRLGPRRPGPGALRHHGRDRHGRGHARAVAVRRDLADERGAAGGGAPAGRARGQGPGCRGLSAGGVEVHGRL
ncbi:MAG: hypothetical protein AVDCRST_MAG60-1452, partial [uncultured Nocardioides sp.]